MALFLTEYALKLPRRFETTTTRTDLLRLLPAAVDHFPFVDEGAAFGHREQCLYFDYTSRMISFVHIALLARLFACAQSPATTG